jgi:hypothetical protein
MVTLEDRAFLRRVTHGSSLQGDKVIYQKALKSELLYRQEQGLPYEHLMDRLAASKARTPVATQEDDDELEVITVASQTPTPVTPRPQRGQSRASEVRFALPRSTPSRAVTPSQTAPPAESPQNEELMYLRERVAQLESMAKQPGPRYNLRRSATPAWGNYNRFQSEVSDYTPEPPRPRRGRGRRGGRQPAMMWDNWSGQWAPAY